MTDFDRAREQFRPGEVRVLFVGESPPADGTFFYHANSKLYAATDEAFRAAGFRPRDSFLEGFSELGCYLDDLCLRPVNHLKLDDPLAKKERLALRVEGEAPLAERMKRQPPRAIIVVMKGIEPNVRAAATAANLRDVPLYVLPFPARPQHRDCYVSELASILRTLKKKGIFP